MHTVQQAHDNIEEYRRVLALLAQADAALRLIPEHRAEDDASTSPSDTISDAEAHLAERIDLLRGWLAVHDREAA